MKTLSERIAERALKRAVGRNARNRAAFLLMRTEIQAAIDDGCVFRRSRTRISVEVEQGFRRKVNSRFA
ncbi:hypothetical protein KDW18_09200 [Burkholderia cenocepacia]|nr:hypothetical protein [Burkholderia cenocepacia]